MALLAAAFMMKSLSFASLLATGKISNTFVQLAAQEGIGRGFELAADKYANRFPKPRSVLKEAHYDDSIISAVEWLVNAFNIDTFAKKSTSLDTHTMAMDYINAHASQLALSAEEHANVASALEAYLREINIWKMSHPEYLLDILQEMQKSISDLQQQKSPENLRPLLEDLQDEINELKQNGGLSQNVHYLTALPGRPTLLHREVELASLEALLAEGKNPVLVNGMGGIGKTALAAGLFHRVDSRYDRIGWIGYTGDLKSSLLADITLTQLSGIQDTEERFQKIMELLRNDACETLLFIDNVNRDIYQDDVLQEMAGWPRLRLVLTSRREAMERFETFPVGFLCEDACVDLFYLYYGSSNRSEEPVVREIVRRARCHTLTVELLAKAAVRQRSLHAYYETLVKAGFEAPSRKIRTGYDQESVIVKKHLQILFDLSGLKDEPELIRILWNFALMPDATIPAEVTDWIGADENDLDELIQRGWLAWENGYGMHPLISEIIRMEPDTMPEDAPRHFLNFLEDNDNNKYFDKPEVYAASGLRLRIAEAFLAAVPQRDPLQQSHIMDNIAAASYDCGHYLNSLKYYKQSLKIKEAILPENSTDTIEPYRHIVKAYCALGEYEKALEFFQKALAIDEKVYGTQHPSTAIDYNNMASVCQERGDYEKALEFFQKALAIDEKVYGTQHPYTATDYNNMALVYKLQGDYEKALEFYQKELAVREKFLGKEHSSTATIYNNIAVLFYYMERYADAEAYARKACEWFTVKLGPNHPYTKIAKSWLDNILAAKNSQDPSDSE